MLPEHKLFKRVFAFDTETGLIAPGLLTPTLVCVSWAIKACEERSTFSGPNLALPEDALPALVDALEDDDTLIVGHNVAYDFGVLANYIPELLPLIFRKYNLGMVSDTMIREQLLDLAAGKLNDGSASGSVAGRRYDMATLWQRYYDEDISEDKKNPDAWRLRYIELHNVPVDQWPEQARKYAADDAVRTLGIWTQQANAEHDVHHRNGNELRLHAMCTDGRVVNEGETVRAAWALHLMGCYGVRTDGHRVGELAAKLRALLAAADEALTHAGVLKHKKGGDKSKDMARIRALVTTAYQGAGLVVPETEKGAVATDKRTLVEAPLEHQPRQLMSMPDGTTQLRPVLAILAETSAIRHNLDTYVEALLGGIDVPITPRWNALVATGRTSCGNPNLQNLPRNGGWRECLLPRPGCVYINADYSTIELRTLAQTCYDWFGQSALRDALNEGVDPHLLLASDILGSSYEQALARKKDKEVKDARQMSKAANFGYPGGLGADSFRVYAKSSYNVDIEPAVAVRLKKIWLSRWPEMRLYFRRVESNINAGYVHYQTGDKAYQLTQPVTGRLRGGTGYCDGCNSYFQGRAADGAKLALYCATQEALLGASPLWNHEELGVSPLYGYRPIILAHDEIVLEGPEDPVRATAAADRLSEVMVQAMQEYVPDIVILAEPAIMRRYSKDAESVRQADGTLSIWEQP